MTERNAELLARLVVGRKRNGRCRYDPLAKQALIDECLNAYSTRWRTRFHADGGRQSTVIADTIPR